MTSHVLRLYLSHFLGIFLLIFNFVYNSNGQDKISSSSFQFLFVQGYLLNNEMGKHRGTLLTKLIKQFVVAFHVHVLLMPNIVSVDEG